MSAPLQTAVPLAQVIDDLVAVAQIPAPTFAEERRLDWLERRLATAPGTRSRDDAGNLVWRWGDGTPRLLCSAHVDNVFDEGTSLVIHRTNDTLTGPGVGDNAAAIAVTLNAVENLHADHRLGPAAVVFTVAEEGLGNLKGARAAIASFAPPLFIAVEGHLLDRVLTEAVGSVRARVGVSGLGGHPWVDRGRPSALHALLTLGTSLLETEVGDGCVNIGLASGGRSVNSIADKAELLVECRSLDPAVLHKFESLLGTLAAPAPLTVQAEILGHRPAGRLDRDHELLRTVLAVRQELGLGTVLDVGSTDANAALAAGIPALTLGVARGGEMHTIDEWIDENSLEMGYRQLHAVLERLLT